MTKVKKPRKKSQKQLLVEALIGDNSLRCNWPLEMKMAGHILAKVNDPDFWFFFAKTHRYGSLVHLLSDVNTTNIVFQAFHDYTKLKAPVLKVAEQQVISNEKIGEDIIIEPSKPKTLKDFLKDI